MLVAILHKQNRKVAVTKEAGLLRLTPAESALWEETLSRLRSWLLTRSFRQRTMNKKLKAADKTSKNETSSVPGFKTYPKS